MGELYVPDYMGRIFVKKRSYIKPIRSREMFVGGSSSGSGVAVAANLPRGHWDGNIRIDYQSFQPEQPGWH